MPIPIISNIIPQNDNPNFGVARDTDMIGGFQVVANVTARDAIHAGRRSVGMVVWCRAENTAYQLRGGVANTNWALWSSDTSATVVHIYVDPAGDDTAPGTVSEPIKTINEAARRASSGAPTWIHLAVGNFPLTDVNGPLNDLYNIGRSHRFGHSTKVGVQGTTVVDGTFKVVSSTNNVITCELVGGGSPGWTTDQHKRRFANWQPFGPTFYYGRSIISNTANTLTIGTEPASMGGFIPMPSPGATITVEHNGSVIVPSTTGIFTSHIELFGCDIVFERVDFDWTAGGTTTWPVEASFCRAAFYECNFIASTVGVWMRDPSNLTFDGCWFRSHSTAAILADRAGCTVTLTGGIVVESSSGFILMRGPASIFNYGAFFFLSGASHGIIFEGGEFHDHSPFIWSDSSTLRYLSLQGNSSHYRKNAVPVVFAAGHTALSAFARVTKGAGQCSCVFNYVDSYSIPSGSFIDDSVAVQTLANFITGTPPASPPAGTIISPKSYVNPTRATYFFQALPNPEGT